MQNSPSQVSSEASTHQPTINIFINDDHVQVHSPVMTGAELAELGHIPTGNQLFLEVPGPGEDRAIRPEESIELKSGMRFYDVPAGNLG